MAAPSSTSRKRSTPHHPPSGCFEQNAALIPILSSTFVNGQRGALQDLPSSLGSGCQSSPVEARGGQSRLSHPLSIGCPPLSLRLVMKSRETHIPLLRSCPYPPYPSHHPRSLVGKPLPPWAADEDVPIEGPSRGRHCPRLPFRSPCVRDTLLAWRPVARVRNHVPPKVLKRP